MENTVLVTGASKVMDVIKQELDGVPTGTGSQYYVNSTLVASEVILQALEKMGFECSLYDVSKATVNEDMFIDLVHQLNEKFPDSTESKSINELMKLHTSKGAFDFEKFTLTVGGTLNSVLARSNSH